MNDPMQMLKADHREVKKMLTALGKSDPGPERVKLVGELDMALRLHMVIEEEFVYPLVAEDVGEDEEREANIEHALARETLEKLVAMVDQPGFGAVAEMLAGGISHHVEEEETEILPELKAEMTRAEWMELGDAIAQAKAAAGEPVISRPRRQASTKRARSAARKPKVSA